MRVSVYGPRQVVIGVRVCPSIRRALAAGGRAPRERVTAIITKHRVFVAAVLVAAAAGFAAVASLPAAAAPPTTGPTPTPPLEALVEAASAAHARGQAVDEYGGLRLAASRDSILVGVTSDSQQARDRLRGSAPAGWFQFRQVPRSWSHLLQTQVQVRQDRDQLLMSEAIRVTATFPSPDTDKLTVEVSPYSAAAKAALEARYGENEVDVMPGLEFHQLASRGVDASPWNGGDFITSPSNNGNCSSGPPVYNLSTPTTTYLLTAGHCYNVGAYVYNGSTRLTGDSNTLIGQVTRSENGTAGYDSAVIAASSSTLDFRTQLAFDTGTRNQYKKSGSVVSAPVCLSGAPSGEVCNTIVDAINIDNFPGEGGTLVNMVRAHHATTPPAGIGDSGGPVYSVDASGLNMQGVIIAGEGAAVQCRNDAQLSVPRGVNCYMNVAYQDLTSVMVHLNLGLRTS